MAEDSSVFGLTDASQEFDTLRGEDSINNSPSSNTDLNGNQLSDEDFNTVRGLNEQNQNSTNTTSVSSKSNFLGTNYSTGILNDREYFNYRGINNKNFVDPNYVSDQHILTIDSIIDHFNKYPSLKMKYTHFAYLKHLGVFPHNRMIIARRYNSPASDDMFNSESDAMTPIATVVSWMDPKESLLELSFNEKWEDATESLISIFKEILEKDFGLNLDPPIPLPGFTAGLQYELMKTLKITNADSTNLPSGNPNLIHETQRRKVPGDDLGGSGLESSFRIEMVCEYEQKYIGRVDPEIAYLDIIGNLLMMGTSNEEFLLTGTASTELQTMFNLAKEGKWLELATEIINAIIAGITTLTSKLGDLLSGTTVPEEGGEQSHSDDLSGKSGTDVVSGFTSGLTAILNTVGSLVGTILDGIFSKYKEKLQAAIAAMSGMPNGPWHIMIGNPKNPFFVSGDMICKKVSIDFKSELAYNDLPAEFTATLEFEPARNFGRVGLGSKFNHGKGRIYGTPSKITNAENTSPSTSATNTSNNISVANKNSI